MAHKVPLSTYYNAVFGSRGFSLAPHHYPMIAGIEDDRIPFLAVIGPPGLGKSTLWSIAAPTWFIGEDPTMTVLGVSAGEKLVGTFLNAAMEIVQQSPHFYELYPDVRPDTNAGWSTERGMFVTGRPIGDQDASYFAAGLKSKALTGVHARRILIDDIHDEGNSATPELRQGVKDSYYKTLLGRADPRGCRFIAAGRRWSTDDIYGEWIKSGEWVVLHLPAVRANEKRLWIDVYVPRGLTCVYTETLALAPDHEQDERAPYVRYRAYYGFDPTGEGFYWPGSETKRRDVRMQRRGSPSTFDTVYQGRPEDSQDKVFLPTDFIPYLPPGDLGMGLASPDVAAFVQQGRAHVAQAWDTAMGESSSKAVSAGITGLIVPCNEWHHGEDEAVFGKCEFHFDVWLLDLLAENLDFSQLVQSVRSMNRKWSPKRVVVEKKVSGISLLQTLKSADVPLYPIAAVEGKINRAVNGVGGGAASVQGWCRLGRVRYPAGMPWVESWLEKVLAFAGDAHGRADEFDATVHLVTYAIMRSKQTGRFASGVMDDAADAVDGESMPTILSATADANEVGKRTGLRGIIGELDAQRDNGPWGDGSGACGSPCKHWVLRDNRRVCGLDMQPRIAFDSCGRFIALGS